MSGLSPEAQRLLHDGRRAHDPPPAARARVRAAVDARLRQPPPRLRALPRWLALAGAVAALALVAWLARTPPPAAPPPVAARPQPAATAPVVAPPAPVVAPAPVAAPAPVVAPPAPVVAPAAAPRARPQLPVDTLAEELRLVGAARRALDGGQLDLAARSLQEHARRFPRGQLAEERDATSARVTCARGDRAASARAAERFLRDHPRSPQAPRVRRACGVE